MLQQGFGLANVVGFFALAYGLVIGLTSNTFSQQVLGGSAWKWLQQGSYVLWALVVVHTAYFLYLHFVSFHRPLPPGNWFRVFFAAIVMATVSLQVAAYLATWRRQRRSRRDMDARDDGRRRRSPRLRQRRMAGHPSGEWFILARAWATGPGAHQPALPEWPRRHL
jgi:sulfoxide reductase heme-binding subunit YedZ